MLVRNLIESKTRSGVVTVPATASLSAAARILIERGIGGLPVVAGDGALVGFLAERDIVRAVHADASELGTVPVTAAMQQPAPTCRIDDDAEQVAARMNRERLRHLVVLEGNTVAGVLSVGDIVRKRVEDLEIETGVLRDYVVAQRARQ